VASKREKRPDGSARDQIVTARVSDLGQRVVFGEERDPRARARARSRPQRRLHTAVRAFDRHPCDLFHELGNPATRLSFLEAELGILVDSAGKRDEPFLDFIDGTIDASAIERHGDYNSPLALERPPLSFSRLRSLFPAFGLTVFAFLCSDCKRRSVAWDTPPIPTVDASTLDAGTDSADAGTLASVPAKKVELKEVAMGTSVTIVAFTNEKVDEAGARALFGKALEELKRLEALLSEWRDDSDIGKLNKGNGEWVSVGPEALEVIQKSILAGKLSDGTFDITFQVMGDLWKFGDASDEKPQVPSRSDVQKKKKLVDYRKIEIDGDKVRLGKSQQIGLGGIAKGYIVDQVVRVLREGGLQAFLVQAGGDLYGAGRKADGSRWVSGIQDPRGGSGRFFGVLELEDHAFSTAGDYARAYVAGGKRYHHIIDPRTGYPATACRSVTIWAPDALTADTVDDAVFILGPQKGLALVESLDGVGAVIVDSSNKVWVSKRLEGKWKQLSAPSDGI
jgi:thiamine biosynthesis lipoprotein